MAIYHTIIMYGPIPHDYNVWPYTTRLQCMAIYHMIILYGHIPHHHNVWPYTHVLETGCESILTGDEHIVSWQVSAVGHLKAIKTRHWQ